MAKFQGRPGSEAWFMWGHVKMLKGNAEQMRIWKKNKRPPTFEEEALLRDRMMKLRNHLTHIENFLNAGFKE